MNKWMIRQTINLARSGSGPQVWPETLMVEGDKNAHTWEITIHDGRSAPDFTGASVTAYFNRADNKAVMVKGEVSGNVASVTLEQQCYAIAGPMVGIFRLTSSDGTAMTLSVLRFVVGKGPFSQIIDPGESIPDLDELLAQIEAMEAATAAADKAADAAQTATKVADLAAANANASAQDAQTATADATEAADAANQAAANAENTVNEAVANANTATAAAADAADAANQAAAKAENAAASASQTIADAADAADRANAAAIAAEDIAGSMEETVTNVELALASKIDGAYVDEDGRLCLTAEGEMVAGPFEVAGGGGTGGGSSNNAVLTLTNTSGWLSKTINHGGTCPVACEWSSLEGGLSTGNGMLTVKVNSVIKNTRDVAQGAVELDIGSYLDAGKNAVKISVTDAYGNSRTLNLSVTTVAVSLASPFDASVAIYGAFEFPYTPTGSVAKTMHFEVDGVEIGTTVVEASGRQQTYTIPAQEHGSHLLRAYFTCEIDTATVTSNVLRYDLICLQDGQTPPVITSSYAGETEEQFTSIVIPYYVHNPASLTSEVVLKANGVQVGEVLTVDRTLQKWTYRATEAGALLLTIESGGTVKPINLTITESSIDVTAETSNLALYLTSYGRSNNESAPANWSYGDIESEFTGFNWTSDGWQSDDDGISVLRLNGDARLYIPMQIFAQDFRGTGKTIEIEFATRNVLNYDAVLLSCHDGSRGLQITAQKALLQSEQRSIGTQYKEDEHVRLSFVAEKTSENRFLFCYINGIVSGVVQYPEDDDFSQMNPVGISVGSSDCTIDLYCIRVYNNGLTRFQIVDNWIADTQDLGLMRDRYARNRVFDAYGNVVIDQLPRDLPYLIVEGAELPQKKKDEKTINSTYVDPATPAKSFTSAGALIDVQGTSSQFYARKNYDIEFVNGFTFDDGTTAAVYLLRDDSVGTNAFCMKADVASSEGANNVELARLYNDVCPYSTPPQVENPSVRQGIDGFPIVIFWNNGSETAFIGKYNFNFSKATPEVFGFSTGDESWEIKNNASTRVLFKSADFSDTSAETGWPADFEARYPEDSTNITQLKAFAAWLVSTDRDAATGNLLPEPVTYDTGKTDTEGNPITVTYTADTADYRLAKYKDELPDHCEIDSALFFYLFTELFLMVDNRAKNAFPSLIGGDKWCWLPYDFDTAIGTNNEGSLVFDYSLEDTDILDSGANVYNGQESVMWCNLRDAYGSEIKAMYQKLRTDGLLSYEDTERRFEEHQAKWPEVIFNEDAYFKYLQPLIDSGEATYLPMLQGSKAEQRKWWLYNRFRYIDSKYTAGDAMTKYIKLRAYANADITVTPYADIYAAVLYGSYNVQTRARRGGSYTLPCPEGAALNDTELAIYSADQLASVGDLSGLMVGLADFSPATRLQEIKLGSDAEGYSNGNLTELYLQNNVLLRSLDVRNCPNLKQSVDASGCTNLEHVWFDGTGITGLSLPNGGIVKTLHLPDTMTNLTIRNQRAITDFVMPGYSKITTLRLENVSDVIDSQTIFGAIPENSRVRLIGIHWELESIDAVETLYDRFDKMRGQDENGGNVEQAQIAGTLHVPEATSTAIKTLRARYPDVNITADVMYYAVSFYDGVSSTPLYTVDVVSGGSAVDPVTSGQIDTPTKAASGNTAYTYAGWDTSLDNITGDTDVTAVYTETRAYTVTFVNWDGTTLHEEKVAEGGSVADPVTSGKIGTPTRPADADGIYTYLGWSGSLVNVTSDRTITARYSTATAVAVTFADWDGTVLYTAYCASGGSVPDPVVAGLIDKPTRPEDTDAQTVYTYAGWDKTFTSVTAATTVTAKYTSQIYYIATFVNYDESVLYTAKVWKGNKVEDPVATGAIDTPEKPAETDYGYIYKGWTPTLSTSLAANATYTAQYKTDQLFTVTFVDYDGTTVLDTQQVYDEGAAVEPVSAGRIGTPLRESTAQYTYTWSGWSGSYSKITADTTITATYTSTTRTYTVRFWDGSTLLATVENVAYNSSATYPNGTPEKTGVDNPDAYLFDGWAPAATSIKGDTDCYASFLSSTIEGTWADVLAAIDDGSYATKYAVGDTLAMDLGTEGMVFMQVAAIDGDTLADGSGKAHLSFISQQLLATSHRMNPSRVTNDDGTYQEGTGGVGGWGMSEMRTYMQETIKPLIPEEVRSRLLTVTKTQPSYTTTGSSETQTTEDDVWLPSYTEVFSSSGLYYSLFPASANRIKKKSGASSASSWWLRSAGSSNTFNHVNTSGGISGNNASNSYGVALGFCI